MPPTSAIVRKRKARSTRKYTPYKKGPGYTRTGGYYGRYQPVSLANSELKFFDSTFSSTNVPSAGSIVLDSLHKVPSGTGESQRVGRKIVVKAINIKMVTTLQEQTFTNTTDDGLRYIVYMDKQCNGQAAAVTDILETATYLSFNNLSNKNRFTILMDKYVDIHATAAGGSTFQSGKVAMTHTWYKKLSFPVEFNSTTGAISEIRSMNVGVLIISDNARVDCNAQIRVRYLDA